MNRWTYSTIIVILMVLGGSCASKDELEGLKREHNGAVSKIAEAKAEMTSLRAKVATLVKQGTTLKADVEKFEVRVANLERSVGPETVLQDDFEDNDISDWKNQPIVKNLLDEEKHSKHPLPSVVDGKIKGIGTGHNYIYPWIAKAIQLREAGALTVFVKGRSGSSSMNQAGIWLLADSWEGDKKPAIGYQLLIHGEDAQRVSVYRHDEKGSKEIARFSIGTPIHSSRSYAVHRDTGGNWSVRMDGVLQQRGQKDRGTKDLTFRDKTYLSFSFVGIHLKSKESELADILIERPK